MDGWINREGVTVPKHRFYMNSPTLQGLRQYAWTPNLLSAANRRNERTMRNAGFRVDDILQTTAGIAVTDYKTEDGYHQGFNFAAMNAMRIFNAVCSGGGIEDDEGLRRKDPPWLVWGEDEWDGAEGTGVWKTSYQRVAEKLEMHDRDIPYSVVDVWDDELYGLNGLFEERRKDTP
jgi:hypothetical protein